MAVTKIHGIKTTVDKAIEYICNPDKTDQNLYISSFACSPETAVLDFKYTLDHTHDCRDPHNTNKAFHLIQIAADIAQQGIHFSDMRVVYFIYKSI